MNEHGPFDEPGFCTRAGQEFVQNGNYRQGAQAFGRVAQLMPTNLVAQLQLALVYILRRTPDDALKITAAIRAQPELFGLTRTNQAELLRAETAAYLTKRDLPSAEAVFRRALAESPGDPDVLAEASRIYMTYGYNSNALASIQEELKAQPDNPAALINLGLVWFRLNDYAQAIPPLTRVVDMGTNAPSDETLYYSALFQRAIAHLQSGQLDQAQEDYTALQKRYPEEFRVAYGLGETAYRKRDTNAAIQHFQFYLSKAPTNLVDEISKVRSRLKELQAGS
jgi:tetratricopeptide (TPR) repeat protein